MVRCPQCGTENPAGAGVCSNCRSVLVVGSDGQPGSGWKIGLVVVVAIVVALAAVGVYMLDTEEPVGSQLKTGSLVITLVNPAFFGGAPRTFELYLDQELQVNGTIQQGDSYVFEKNMTWEGPELEVLIHVQVFGVSIQPEDRLETITPGEVQRVTVMFSTV